MNPWLKSASSVAFGLILGASTVAVAHHAGGPNPLGLNVFQRGDPIVAEDVNQNFHLLAAEIAELRADLDAERDKYIEVDTDIVVGPGGNTDFPNLPVALAALSGRRIAGGATVHVLVLPVGGGAYAMPGPLDLNHPDGDRISIEGQGAPDDVVLDFGAGTYGLVIGNGNRLGNFENIVIRGIGASGAGVSADQASLLRFGIDVHVDGFATGVEASNGATIMARGLNIERGSTFCIRALYGGRVIDDQPRCNSNFGIVADTQALVVAPGAVVRAAETYGVLSHVGSVIYADGANVQSGNSAFLADLNSTISAGGAIGTVTGGGGEAAFRAEVTSSVSAETSEAHGGRFGYSANANSFVDAIASEAHDSREAAYQAAMQSMVNAQGTTLADPPATHYRAINGGMVLSPGACSAPACDPEATAGAEGDIIHF